MPSSQHRHYYQVDSTIAAEESQALLTFSQQQFSRGGEHETNPPQPGELRWTKNLPSLLLKVYYCMHTAVVMGLLARINSKLNMGEFYIPNINA